MTTRVPLVTLSGSATIPQLGYGVFQIPPDETAAAVAEALATGYRHIDTAQMYRNERGVGEGVRASGLPREDVWITSKLSNAAHRPDDARRAIDATLTELGTDHVDLYLIHWPLPTRFDGDFVSTWRVLGEALADGRARTIGVSNFTPAHLDRIVEETGIAPAVNQIEVHPYFANDETRAATQRHGAVVEAWSPIAQGAVLGDPVITAIAERLGATASQVVLAWHLGRGDIVFPKTTHADRMAENLAAVDVRLSGEDVAAISALDKGEAGRTGPNPDAFDYIPG
ncbi:aldo/keto reductase [Actinotalea sp. M2MS4P-6]|uniref:aldo/keto reductase n=1 Tax=Actinotalea sp. M2MS4P-6 TaxID=2983762 RepID=UPI0021E41FB0|nr:aldo/keto reductase [Actinotalea sp. M2MS4P-6]MCV2393328.1 aldo/keto reductase [Actinotalea sp. M2MS4P-6]